MSTRAVWPALVTGLLWCAAAASAVFWVLQFPQEKSALNAPVVKTGVSGSSGAEASAQALRALGGKPQGAAPEVVVAQTSRYQLWGVVAGASGQGSALIGIDGQPPKAYRVGQAVGEGLKLVSLTPKQARLDSSGQPLVLDLPASGNP